jgi:hypothetical protein
VTDQAWHTDDKLEPDDVLLQAIGQLHDAAPSQDLWAGVSARIHARSPRQVSVTWAQLALAASLLMAVSSGLTWLVARQATTASSVGHVVRAEAEPSGAPDAHLEQANFADAQYNAAVVDLERVLREDRTRLDPRTVMVIERNLQTIDDAIGQARRALDADPANPYLNSHLADARRRKLDLLRRATELASTGGN